MTALRRTRGASNHRSAPGAARTAAPGARAATASSRFAAAARNALVVACALLTVTAAPARAGADGTGPAGDGVDLVASVPAWAPQMLTLSVASSAPIPFSGVRDGSGNVRASSMLPAVTVHDARPDGQLTTWEVNAQASAFSGTAGAFGGEYLGWVPSTPTVNREVGSSLQAQAGAAVYSRLTIASSGGLGVTRILMRSTQPGRGAATISTMLSLAAPVTVAPGTYTSTLTITLVSS